MYSSNIVENGIAYTIYFFASFSGHFQPFTPVSPLDFDEIHRMLIKYDSAPYFQGWYSETSSDPRLDKLIKYWLMRRPFKGAFDQKKEPGIYYHKLVKIDGKWQVKEPINPEVVLKQEHYLIYSVDEDGKPGDAYHVYSSVIDSFIYTYSLGGTLKNTEDKAYEIPSVIPDF